MNYLLITFGVIIVVVSVVLVLVRFLPKPTRSTTATTNNAPTTRSARTFITWDGIRNAWFPVIALIAALICGYIINPDFTRKVVENRKFLTFLILGGTAYFFLSVHAPFKENKLRKLILFAFLLWGVVLLLDVTGINIPKSISNAFSSKSRSTVLDGGRFQPIEVNVTPDKWTPVKLSPGTNYTIERFGRLEYLLSNGRIVVAEDGENVALGMAPSTNFKLRGTAGKVVFTPTQ